MKTLLAAFLLCSSAFCQVRVPGPGGIAPSSGGSGPALIKHVLATPGSDGGMSAAIDTTGGDFAVIAVASFTSGGFTISDARTGCANPCNTWTSTLTQYSSGGIYPYLKFYYSQNHTVGAGHTFSCVGVGTYCKFDVAAFSGMKTTGVWVSGQDAGNGSSSAVASLATGSITPGTGYQLVDRKSTRLNSSHRCISYAVFC